MKKGYLMTKKLNLTTLAANAARAKQRLNRQEKKLRGLCDQIIARVGTGGQTIQTTLGQVIVTAETVDRNIPGFIYVFNPDNFEKLTNAMKLHMAEAGVVVAQKRVVHGCSPKVQFRLVEKD
jgi:hypothetical protein